MLNFHKDGETHHDNDSLSIGVDKIWYTLFDLITAPATITAPPDFLLYFHLSSSTWRSFSWLFTLFSLIITHLTILWH